MRNFIRNHKLLTALACLLIASAVAACAYIIYSRNRVNLLDRSLYSELASNIQDAADSGLFTDQAALSNYITSWADDNGLSCKTDSQGNIIFNTKAASLKKNVSPSVVCVSFNYETAGRNADLLASAAMIAATEINSGRKTVIFVNDEQNLGKGYKALSKKYFSGKSKVIYLDQGTASYISASSFGRNISSITIPAKREKVKCDTAVKIHITGITPDEISTSAANYPDPVAAFSTLLTRLKSKSAIFQLADFEVGSDGLMYPVSLDATFVLNSYAVGSFTNYIDKRIKAWDKTYSGDFPDISYTYEIVENDDDLPRRAYSSAASGRLANVLYTIKSGTYTYADGDAIPEGRDEGDIYGINRVTDITAGGDSIAVKLVTMAFDEDYMQRISDDDRAAAELFGCTYSVDDSVPAFRNDKDSLYRTLTSTYYKVCELSGTNSLLPEESDNYYTPCHVLASKGKDSDVIHLRLNPKRAAFLTNTILCYIATKGNFFSLQ